MKKIKNSLSLLKKWIEENNLRSYDPYDVKGAPIFVSLEKIKPLRIFLSSFTYLFPEGSRKILKIKKVISPQAVAQCCDAWFNIGEIEKTKKWLKWLEENTCPPNPDKIGSRRGCTKHKGFGWGENFDWLAGRKILIPLGTPDIFCTSIVGNTFLRAYKTLKEKEYLDYANQSARFIIHSLNIDRPEDSTLCFSYTPIDNFHIINVNAIAGAFLLKLGKETDNIELIEMAEQVLNYVIRNQKPDGSFEYWGTPEPSYQQIDNYHTGFILRSLCNVLKISKREKIKESLIKGYKYYVKNLFLGEIPKSTPKKLWPINIQSCAESIFCLSTLSDFFPETLELAEKVASWTIKNMQDKEGYFYYRKYPCFTIKIPFMRWSDAPMFQAFSSLASSLNT